MKRVTAISVYLTVTAVIINESVASKPYYDVNEFRVRMCVTILGFVEHSVEHCLIMATYTYFFVNYKILKLQT